MVDLKGFRAANKLSQKDLADYLGVSREFVSMAEGGKAQLPHVRLCKLLANDSGWDVSMLEDNRDTGDSILQAGGHGNIGKIAGDSSAELLALRKENEMLRKQLEDVKSQNEKYWSMIEKLTTK